MAKFLVSVVLPTYNGEKYICEAIESILEQTYSNWELIVVDDCSNDKTGFIVDQYAEKDKRIKVIHNLTNQKLPQALNIGFSIAKGDLLTWTSDDNRLLSNAIQVMQRYFMENSNVHMVRAGMRVIDDTGIHRKELDWEDKQELCIQNNVGACFMYTRDVYNKVGDYDKSLFCMEDYDYWIRVEKLYGKICRIGDILYEYRWHKESLTETKKELIDCQLIKLREKHMDYILNFVKDNKPSLFYLYADSMRRGCSVRLFNEIVHYLPEQQNEIDVVNKDDKFVIFGAGQYGEQAAMMLSKKAVFFADNDKKKVGQIKNDLKIVSFEELVDLSKKYCIMVAVDSPNIYEMIHQLLEFDIHNYCTYQFYLWYIKNR